MTDPQVITLWLPLSPVQLELLEGGDMIVVIVPDLDNAQLEAHVMLRMLPRPSM